MNLILASLLVALVSPVLGLDFEILLPYRLDLIAEMKLTTDFKREFMHTLTNYEASKEATKPVISMPNSSIGALRICSVSVYNDTEYNDLFKMMDDLSKRVFRSGLNPQTAGGNFRLPIRGLDIDPKTRFIYTKFDQSYPTDSLKRFTVFMKSLFHRLKDSKLKYELIGEIRLDRLVLGLVLDKKAVDFKRFHDKFDDFDLGFAIFNRLLLIPKGDKNLKEEARSIFYFDHVDHEPIIGVVNDVILNDEESDGEL